MRDHPVLELLRERRVASSAMAEALQQAGCTDCLPLGTPVVSQLERDPALLSAAAAAARRHLTSVIDLEEVRS